MSDEVNEGPVMTGETANQLEERGVGSSSIDVINEQIPISEVTARRTTRSARRE